MVAHAIRRAVSLCEKLAWFEFVVPLSALARVTERKNEACCLFNRDRIYDNWTDWIIFCDKIYNYSI